MKILRMLSILRYIVVSKNVNIIIVNPKQNIFKSDLQENCLFLPLVFIHKSA